MKKLILQLMVCLLVSTLAQAQAPNTINYQAVVRNSAGEVIKNQNVRFRLSVTEGLNGATVYSETYQVTTNMLGLVNISIGSGVATTGSMSAINWGGIAKYLKIEVDITGGTNFILMGSQQLVSVPYSLHSNTASSVLNQWQFNPNGIHYNLGKVGIGTATPEAKLSLVGDETGVTPAGVPDTRRFLYMKNSSTGQYSNVYTQLQAGASNSFMSMSHHASSYSLNDLADFGQIWASGRGLVLRAAPTSATEPNISVIKFMTGFGPNGGSNERMRITETGLVGIGTTAPKAILHLEGNEDGSGTSDTRNFIFIKNNTTSSSGAGGIGIQAGSSSGETRLWHISPQYASRPQDQDFGTLYSSGQGLSIWSSNRNNPTTGRIKFQTGANSVGGFDRMVIDEIGNIGVGTSAPKAKLEVKDGDVYVNDPTKGIILKSPNGGCWRVTIDNTGNFVRTSIACPN
jgi:hypothetical protein